MTSLKRRGEQARRSVASPYPPAMNTMRFRRPSHGGAKSRYLYSRAKPRCTRDLTADHELGDAVPPNGCNPSAATLRSTASSRAATPHSRHAIEPLVQPSPCRLCAWTESQKLQSLTRRLSLRFEANAVANSRHDVKRFCEWTAMGPDETGRLQQAGARIASAWPSPTVWVAAGPQAYWQSALLPGCRA